MIEVSGRLAADFAGGTLSNTATVTSATDDPDGADNSDTVVVPVVGSADLTLTKTGPRTAARGAQVRWTVRVANAGPSVARSVTVTDTLPAGVTAAGFVVAEDGVLDCSAGGGTVTCTAPELAVGASIEVEVFGTLARDFPEEGVTNTATVAAGTADPDTEGNSDTVITAVVDLADPTVTVAVGPDAVVAGGSVTWTLAAANLGSLPADSVVVSGRLPAGTRFGSGSPGCTADGRLVTCRVGSLDPAGSRPGAVTAAAASVALTVTAAVDPAVRGELVLRASVAAAGEDANPDNNAASVAVPVAAVADLGVTKTASRTRVPTGGTLRYTVAVTNDGPSAALGAEVVENWPAGLELLDAAASQGRFDPATRVWALGPLAPGARATLTLDVRATGSGPVTNAVSLRGSDATDPDPDDQAAAVRVDVLGPAGETPPGETPPVDPRPPMVRTGCPTPAGPPPAWPSPAYSPCWPAWPSSPAAAAAGSPPNGSNSH